MASDDDDPCAPYKVYEGDECKGTYPTRAEARRAQQRLAESEPQLNFFIRDILGDVVSWLATLGRWSRPKSAAVGRCTSLRLA